MIPRSLVSRRSAGVESLRAEMLHPREKANPLLGPPLLSKRTIGPSQGPAPAAAGGLQRAATGGADPCGQSACGAPDMLGNQYERTADRKRPHGVAAPGRVLHEGRLRPRPGRQPTAQQRRNESRRTSSQGRDPLRWASGQRHRGRSPARKPAHRAGPRTRFLQLLGRRESRPVQPGRSCRRQIARRGSCLFQASPPPRATRLENEPARSLERRNRIRVHQPAA